VRASMSELLASLRLGAALATASPPAATPSSPRR
jgi:hypothetical protein